jgi:hypothetical protein
MSKSGSKVLKELFIWKKNDLGVDVGNVFGLGKRKAETEL